MSPGRMRASDLHYELPAGLIAQEPAAERDASRLLVLDRAAGALHHHAFRELPALLRAGDVLVLNDTKVLPARLAGRWESEGAVEALLIRELAGGAWEALLKPASRARPGRRLVFGDGADLVPAVVEAYAGPGRRLLRFAAGTDVRALMDRHGLMPLPAYIRRPGPAHSRFGDPHSALDRERYQTIYARQEGAIAAPTAGLHFTPAVLAALQARGVVLAWLTLHVGPGTFRPIRAERLADHRMEPEPSIIPEATARAVKAAKAEGRRVVAVGTTVVRALEHAARETGEVAVGPGEATLFIAPGHRFRVVDAMLTNFHLPGSTPLALVAALAGLEPIKAAYAEAAARRYRFYSYGDAMLIL